MQEQPETCTNSAPAELNTAVAYSATCRTWPLRNSGAERWHPSSSTKTGLNVLHGFVKQKSKAAKFDETCSTVTCGCSMSADMLGTMQTSFKHPVRCRFRSDEVSKVHSLICGIHFVFPLEKPSGDRAAALLSPAGPSA